MIVNGFEIKSRVDLCGCALTGAALVVHLDTHKS